MRETILDVAKRADACFMQRSPIHAAMRRLATTLGEMEIPFAIAGAMAANAHGHQRTTADIDILIRRENIRLSSNTSVGAGSTSSRDRKTFVIRSTTSNG